MKPLADPHTVSVTFSVGLPRKVCEPINTGSRKPSYVIRSVTEKATSGTAKRIARDQLDVARCTRDAQTVIGICRSDASVCDFDAIASDDSVCDATFDLIAVLNAHIGMGREKRGAL